MRIAVCIKRVPITGGRIVLTADARAIEPSSTRAAGFYLAGTTVIGVLMFPILPRVRNPIVPGLLEPLYNLDVAESRSFFVGDHGALVHDNTLPASRTAPFDAEPVFE